MNLTPRRRNFLAIAAVAGAVTLHILAQFSMVMMRPGWSLATFRNYYATDQLSYLGIVANAAEGQFDAFEPFTETGSIYYPRYYYLLLGAGARLFNLTPTTSWAIGGLACQVVLVAVVAIACILMSRRLWTGLFGAVPFVLGTLSVVTRGDWLTRMDSHAVLWGPFAVLFPLNAETAGLCAGGIALLLILLSYARVRRRWMRVALALVASVIVGLLANVQTFSFLTIVYLVVFPVAAYAVVSQSRRWAGWVSLALVPVVVILGPRIAHSVGPLAALVFGLLPAAPGLVLATIRTRGLVAWCGIAAVAFASPSVFGTLIGLRERDPFLVYRVASSVNLGVIWTNGVRASLVLLVPLGLVFLAGLRRKNPLWISFPLGTGLAWVLISTNDRWGANQEPYRFWIDGFMLISVALLPIFITVVQEFVPVRAPEVGTVSRFERPFAIVSLGLVMVLALVSMADWVKFYRDTASGLGLISYQGPRELAIAEAAKDAGGGLILTDPCVDPLTVKVVSGVPVVFMNPGMAWPEHYDAIRSLQEGRGADVIKTGAAAEAGVQWLMTDSSCDSDWAADYSSKLADPVEVDYTVNGRTSTITLWALELGVEQ